MGCPYHGITYRSKVDVLLSNLLKLTMCELLISLGKRAVFTEQGQLPVLVILMRSAFPCGLIDCYP